MTDLERRERMTQRNAAICAYYQAGHTTAECGKKFGLKRQRAQQILKRAGVWQPYVKSGRTEFLGVSVKEATKKALRERADSEGISVSQLASDTLDASVASVEPGIEEDV